MTTLIIIVGFTFIIFIHELGHFLAARRVGIKVEVFSIGVGPKLLSLFKDSQGTEYILSILPLGGYVKMLGQEDLPQKTPSKKPNPQNFNTKTPAQRLFVVIAGVVMNLLSAYVLITLAYTLGIGFTTNKVGGLEPGTPIAQSGIRIGEEIIALNDRTIDSYEDILIATAFTGDKEIIKLQLRAPDKTIRTVDTFAYKNAPIPIAQLGVIPYGSATIRKLTPDSSYYISGLRNGMVIDKVVLNLESQSTQPTQSTQPIIVRQTARGILQLINDHPGEQVDIYIRNSEDTTAVISNITIPQIQRPSRGFEVASKVNVTPNYPAQKAGLANGDVITALNNIPIRSFESLQTTMQTFTTNNEAPLVVGVRRGEKALSFTLAPFYDAGTERLLLGVSAASETNNSQVVSHVSPEMEAQVPGIRVGDQILDLKQEPPAWNVKLIRDEAEISFQYGDDQFKTLTYGQPPPITAGEKIIQYNLGEALYKSFGFFYRELEEVFLFIGKLIWGALPANTIGGPIAVFDTFQTLSAVKGFSYFLLLFAKISISLAIVNMLPIPLLDGGHAAFIGYEMIRRKPAPEHVIRIMNFIGFILLIFLMIFVNYNDIMRIVSR